MKSLARIRATAAWLASVPAAVAGPIFAKELRVSSRRRRNYVLRTAYVALMTVFVVLIWLNTVRWEEANTYARRVMVMSEAGRIIAISVVWFQFVVAQLLTVILLSTSISEEVYRRTLGVLMTTPVRSFQIVLGKLASKMLQLVMLLALSLPLLGILRILGGVPWDFVLAGVCITLCAAAFTASVSMFFSILFRRAYVSILCTLGVGLMLYLVVPAIVGLGIAVFAMAKDEAAQALLPVLTHGNPFVALQVCTFEVIQPRALAPLGFFFWPVNCAVMLGLAAAVLLACVAMVRRAALRQATGGGRVGVPPLSPAQPAATPAAQPRPEPAPVQPGDPDPGDPRQELVAQVQGTAVRPAVHGAPVAAGRIRAVTGSPIVWKELHAPWMRRKLLGLILLGIGLLLVLAAYGLLAAVSDGEAFTDDDVHAAFVVLWVLVAITATAILSATNITSEKEAGSWEILLGTPLSGWHILLGKAAGVLKRCLPVWLLPLGHAVFFVPLGCVHPVLPVHLVLVMVSVVVLFTGSGLYFGTRFKRTTTAVILSVALALTLWAILPLVVSLTGEALPQGGVRKSLRSLTEVVLDVNPVFQAAQVTEWGSGTHRAGQSLGDLDYRWEYFQTCSAGQTTVLLMGCAVGYAALGGLLAWLARLRLRRSAA